MLSWNGLFHPYLHVANQTRSPQTCVEINYQSVETQLSMVLCTVHPFEACRFYFALIEDIRLFHCDIIMHMYLCRCLCACLRYMHIHYVCMFSLCDVWCHRQYFFSHIISHWSRRRQRMNDIKKSLHRLGKKNWRNWCVFLLYRASM